MENLLIDSATVFKRVAVSKTRFPEYHFYRANGIPLPPLPYSLHFTFSRKVTYRQTYTNVNWAYGSQTTVFEQPQAWWSDNRNALGLALRDYYDITAGVDADLDNRLLERLKGQSVSIGLMYAERKQTNDLLISTLDRLLRAMKMIRHPKRMFRELTRRNPTRREVRHLKRITKRVSQTADTVADAWIMYRYAWMPLVLDCRDAVRALANQKKKMYRHSIQAGAKLVFESNVQRVSFAASNDLDTQTKGFYGAHIKCFYDVTNPLATAWSSLADPLQQAWDFVPFSFIVDWFCDVSTALDLRSATWGTTFTSGYRSSMSSRTLSSFPVKTSTPYWWSGGVNWSIYETKVVPDDRIDITVTRTVLTKFPDLHLIFPLEEGLNVVRVFDLAALLTSYGARKFRSFTHT